MSGIEGFGAMVKLEDLVTYINFDLQISAKNENFANIAMFLLFSLGMVILKKIIN